MNFPTKKVESTFKTLIFLPREYLCFKLMRYYSDRMIRIMISIFSINANYKLWRYSMYTNWNWCRFHGNSISFNFKLSFCIKLIIWLSLSWWLLICSIEEYLGKSSKMIKRASLIIVMYPVMIIIIFDKSCYIICICLIGAKRTDIIVDKDRIICWV